MDCTNSHVVITHFISVGTMNVKMLAFIVNNEKHYGV
jgi:hypothetical protein